MLILVASIALAVAGFIGYMLVIVGTHFEGRDNALADTPPNLLAAYARRVMSVSVQRPRPSSSGLRNENRDLSTTGRR